LLEDAVERANRHVAAQLPASSNSDGAGLGRVTILHVSADGPDVTPAVGLDHADHFAILHRLPPILSATPHRVPAVQTLVAGAAADGDAAADVAGGGVGLHVGALLAEGVGEEAEP